MKYEIYSDNGLYYWKLLTPDGTVLAQSGEGVPDESRAIHHIKLVQDSSGAPIFDKSTQKQVW